MKNSTLGGRWLLGLLLVLGWAPVAWGQSPVTVSPAYFTADTQLTLTYDATLGNAGLANYTGDVFIWTGVITDKSTSDTNWHFVAGTTYGATTDAQKLTALGNHKYSITFTPRTYYPGFATSGEVLKKLAMVFRGTGGTPEGKGVGNSDILVAPGVQVSFTSPATANTVVAAGTSVAVAGTATVASTITLTLNGTQVAQQTNATSLSTNVTLSQQGTNTLVLTATDGTTTASATTTVTVAPTVTTVALPSGAKADGITYLAGGTSVILTLTAPKKSFVYVIGEFNNWQATPAGLMNKTSTVDSDPATGRWWVQLDGLTPGQEYAYQFLVDGQLRVADPYCEKILDPDNDKYIPAVTYPNLRAYPTGSTTGLVSVLQTSQAPYNWVNTSYKRPARTNMVVYELLVRDFTLRHDYQTLKDTLNYIQRLGVNTIELMPINEFDGNDNWGYSPCFYFAPDKYYGTKNALKAFIDECHRRNISVVLDMVLNHSTGQSPMVQLYGSISGGPTADNPWFNTSAPHPYSVYNDLNHESPYTRYFSKNVIKFWLQEYHIDGYRFDLAGGFSQVPKTEATYPNYDQSRVNIWEDYYNTQIATDPTSYPILEHFPNGVSASNPTDEGKVLSDYGMMLWSNLNYNYTQAAMGYSDGWNLSYGYYGDQGGRGWGKPNAIGYMESHDEERMQFKNKTYGNASGSYSTRDQATGLKRDEMSAALFFSQPGPRMVWMFGELGYDYSINTCSNGTTISNDCRTAAKPIRWDYQQDANRQHLYSTYKAMATLKQQPVFSSFTSYTQNLGGAVKTINIANADLAVVTYGNFDVNAQTTTITFPSTGTWYNYLTGGTMSVTSTSMALTLQPGDYAVYTSRSVAQANPLGTRPAETAAFKLSLAPNPAAGTTAVAYELPAAATATLQVQSLLGQMVRQLPAVRQAAGAQTQVLSLQGLAPGVYLVKLTAGDLTQTTRLLVQ
ncbi:T9SS type A sorting domain-containing protein [Hymenobacter sp. RP-2-7]|uniref:T9SS type A sorting domain-containing protein n=1 Tax=Hymenobacter polaris TaxID=2682546 RepID=A0A7Y0FKT4_9BACT|nr:alpha-amylase family glycosyl hydrolase [Hymenobacter polaris]NML63719.1 T9SS type A sorting domain-containing protein [Hymenobacter polaris]